MSDSLKEKTGSALFWNFIDKGGQQIIQFGFMYVLLRLLSPEEFGQVGVLAIFTAIANLLQESGFSSALIRKTEADEKDYSSIFYFNVSIGIFIYILLFFFAPVIANYYETPILTNVSRVLFLSFLFNSFGIIQNVHLIKKMDFKSNARITFIAGLASGIVSIAMAFQGLGVWSLAIQPVLQALIRSLLLWYYVQWYPKAGFVFQRIKAMFSYSVKLLLTSLFNQIAGNIYSIVIGKHFSLSQVGYYTQANKLNYIPQAIISTSVQGVAYPLLTKVEENIRKKKIFRKIVRITAFIAFPVSLLIITSAHPFIILAFSDKWAAAIPLLQVLAIGASVYPLYSLISSLLQSVGKSGLLLKIEIARNILSLASIFISINYGVIGLVWGVSIVSVIAFGWGFYFSGKCIEYNLKEVAKDICPYLVIAIASFLPIYFIVSNIDSLLIKLLVQIIVSSTIYLLIVKWMGSKVLEDCIDFLKNKTLNK